MLLLSGGMTEDGPGREQIQRRPPMTVGRRRGRGRGGDSRQRGRGPDGGSGEAGDASCYNNYD